MTSDSVNKPLLVRIWRRAGPGVLLLFVTIAFFWKLTLTNQYTWLDHPDMVLQVMPWLQHQASEWRQGRFPFWDPHLWAGQPLVGQVQPGTLNPLNWLLFAAPMRGGFIRTGALDWYFVLIHFLAALLYYVFCRDLRLSRSAAFLAACAFAFGGFMGTTGWPQMLFSALWLPLVAMYLLRAFEGDRPPASAAMAGALLGLAFLGTHHGVPAIFAVMCAGFWVYYLASRPGRLSLRSLAPCLLFGACFLLTASAQILPARELGKLSLRWVNAPSPVGWEDKVPYAVHEDFSLYPTSLLGIVVPGINRGPDPFAGLVVFSLALLGVKNRWRERPVQVLTALSLFGLFFALGAASVFHGLLYSAAPLLDKVRNPAMALALFHLGIAALAGYGVDWLRAAAPGSAVKTAVNALLALGLALFAILAVLVSARPEKGREYFFMSLAALAAVCLAAILAALARAAIRPRTGLVLLLLLMLFELHNVATYGHKPRTRGWQFLPKLEEHTDIARFLRERPEPVRVDADSAEIPYNFGDWFGVDQLGGLLPGALKHIISKVGEPRAREILAVNYSIARVPAAGQTAVFEGRGGLKVFRNAGALPRVRTAHSVVMAKDWDAALAETFAPGRDPRGTVVVEGMPPRVAPCAASDRVAIASYEPGKVVIETDMACDGMVILADAWFPGWIAEVDGRPATLYRAYGMVRGVAVERGRRRVVMRYRPRSVFYGTALAIGGLLLALVLQREGAFSMITRSGYNPQVVPPGEARPTGGRPERPPQAEGLPHKFGGLKGSCAGSGTLPGRPGG